MFTRTLSGILILALLATAPGMGGYEALAQTRIAIEAPLNNPAGVQASAAAGSLSQGNPANLSLGPGLRIDNMRIAAPAAITPGPQALPKPGVITAVSKHSPQNAVLIKETEAKGVSLGKNDSLLERMGAVAKDAAQKAEKGTPRSDSAAQPGTEDSLQKLFDGSRTHSNSVVNAMAAPAPPPPVQAGPAKKTTPAADPQHKNPPSKPLPDTDPGYYKATPDWAKRLAVDPKESFETEQDYKKYQDELQRLRPLARWMAHFYSQIKEDQIQRPPNLLTIQDILNWVGFVKKFDNATNWNLPIAVVDGIKAMFAKTLPEMYEGRKLQQELETKLKDAQKILSTLEVPEHLGALNVKENDPKDSASKTSSMVEYVDEEPSLLPVEDIKDMDGPDYIMTETVSDRYYDLLTLYDPKNYGKKFFPLLIGDTGEGKSSLIQFIFAQPAVKKWLGGRSVPVVPIPVKESHTRRELLGGKGPNGIELGFLSRAVMNGWVLVLEELNQASPEFLKCLNEVLHQLRKQGFFEFEVGGQTVRIKAHPHFWIVGTENPEEGNYSISRNPHSPDFLKRWVVRYYNRFPPAEQAEIMRGLAARWYGDDFAKRYGLSQAFFEKIVTGFHEPLRKMVGVKLGSDLQEPYEFNRRTLHRFLKRYLSDLYAYETTKKPLDEKTRYTLMARELMEAYGVELRDPGEKDALWDKMNVTFDLGKNWKIAQEDIRIEVTGFYQDNNKLVVEERLVPMQFPIRAKGGDRVPGPRSRMTLIPSMAENVYRNLRNRQFREHQFSTGPTGTAKTSEIEFINHMLGEPLFAMGMDDQTPMSEFHGGYMKDPATGEFKFFPGVLARAMMYDPEGLLKGKTPTSAAEIRKNPRIGGTLQINEGNASPIIESINPALDNGILHLSDGQHSAVAGANFHVVVTMNPVGEGYLAYPLTGALTSRGQTIFHPGGMPEEELTEIILDKLTGLPRYLVRDKDKEK